MVSAIVVNNVANDKKIIWTDIVNTRGGLSAIPDRL